MRQSTISCVQNQRRVSLEPLESRCLLTIGSFSVTQEPDGVFGGGSAFAVDIDRDGDSDLIHGIENGQMVLFENDNGISFDNPGTEIAKFPESGTIADFEVADIDGDGDLDFVATSVKAFYTKQIAWFENTGNSYEFKFVDQVSSFGTNRLALIDVDGDRLVDILLPGKYHLDNPYWYRNVGNGEFEPLRIYENAIGDRLTIADIDLDGDLDLLSVSGNETHDQFWRWVDLRTGQPQTAIELPHAFTTVQSHVAVDVDGDGDTDVVIQESDHGERRLIWYENEGGGQFINHHEFTKLRTNHELHIFIRDFDFDGDVDFGEFYGDFLTIHENLGANRFRAVTSLVEVRSILFTVAIDVDGDHDLDIVSDAGSHIHGGNRGGIQLYEQQIPQVGDSNRDGQFDSSDLVAVFGAGEFEDGIDANSTFAEGDWNGDGDFDSSDIVAAFQAGTYETAARPKSLYIAVAVDLAFEGHEKPFLKTKSTNK